jgi:hypothetical protein
LCVLPESQVLLRVATAPDEEIVHRQVAIVERPGVQPLKIEHGKANT